MMPLAVAAYTATSAMGHGLAAQRETLESMRSGLRPNDFGSAPLTCWIGRVDGLEQAALPACRDGGQTLQRLVQAAIGLDDAQPARLLGHQEAPARQERDGPGVLQPRSHHFGSHLGLRSRHCRPQEPDPHAVSCLHMQPLCNQKPKLSR